jgi:hypothetical protein
MIRSTRRSFLKGCAATAPLILSPALFGCLGITNIRFFTDESVTNTEPVVEYYAGRYRFGVPRSMELADVGFAVAATDAFIGKDYATWHIKIEETPWKPGDTAQQFRDSWEKFRESDKASLLMMYGPALRDSEGDLRYAENLDARNIFGYEAVSIATTFGGFPYFIHTFIALPQGLLKLTEKRDPGGDVDICTEIEAPAAHVFRHYKWEKRPASRPDTFYTAMGMVEDYSSKYEEALLFFTHPDGLSLSMESRYDTRDWGPETGFKSQEQIEAMARRLGVGYRSHVRRERQFVEQPMLERIERMWEGDKDNLYFRMQSLGSGRVAPTRPDVEIVLRSPWGQREQAMAMWNTVLQNVRPLPESGPPIPAQYLSEHEIKEFP